MPATLERPVFVEDQVLTPDDLNALIGYARAQLARHARSAHTWGIVEGLGLHVEAGNLVIEPGWAVDSAGAPLVVPRNRPVAVVEFQKNLSRNEKDGPYPVFLAAARSDRRAARPLTDDRCGVRRGTGADETPEVLFARPGELDGPGDPAAPDLARGPDPDAFVPELRRVLIGFVRLKDNAFTGAAAEVEETPHRPRYAGVIAGEVRAAQNALTLRSRPAGAVDAPLLVLGKTQAEGKSYSLVFGTDDGTGQVGTKWQLRIGTDGVVETKGAVNPNNLLRDGETRVQSGTITDGLRVPLPNGLDEEAVLKGRVQVHVLLTPRPDLSQPPPTVGTIGVPHVCRVDAERRVECVFAWFSVGPSTAAQYLPGVCDYTMIVTRTTN